jgi:CoA:oxalate CoA-transferase
MVLARLGANVVKVVPPWGDSAVAPAGAGSAEVEDQLQRDKTVERLDLANSGDRARLNELVRRADAVVVAGPAGFRRKFRLGPGDLGGLRAGLVYCGLTGYGDSGPLADSPATEFDVQVAAGMTRQLGRPEDLPVRHGFHLVSVNTGYATAQAVLAGLLVGSDGPGLGRHFEVSLLRTALCLNGWNITAESGSDGVVGKQVLASTWPPDHGYTCRDRQVLISLRNNDEGWVKLFANLDRVDLLADERFNELAHLRANEWQLAPILAETTARFTSEEFQRMVAESEGDLVPVLDPTEVLDHPQSRAQNLTIPGTTTIELPIDVVTR